MQHWLQRAGRNYKAEWKIIVDGSPGCHNGKDDVPCRLLKQLRSTSHIDITGTVNTVPEPATFVLLVSGLAGVGAAIRKLRKSME